MRGHVVLSHDHLDLEGEADLGTDVVLRLADTAITMRRLVATCPDAMTALRPQLMAFLLGLQPLLRNSDGTGTPVEATRPSTTVTSISIASTPSGKSASVRTSPRIAVIPGGPEHSP